MMRLVMTQNLTSLMIVTLGLGYVIQGGSALIFGGNPHTFPGDAGRREDRSRAALVHLAGCTGAGRHTLVLYGAVWVVYPEGRATARSFGRLRRIPKLAGLFEINAQVVYLLVFVFECAAVAIGAALVAPRSPILTSMGFNEVIMTFVVVVVGEIGSIGGALAAGLGLGLSPPSLARSSPMPTPPQPPLR